MLCYCVINNFREKEKMYTDWKDYFTQLTPTEEYIPDNISSKNLSSIVFFIFLGIFIAMGLISRVEGKSGLNIHNSHVDAKIQKIKNEIMNLEAKNTYNESEILILNHSLTQMFQNKEKTNLQKTSNLTGAYKTEGPGVIIRLSDSDKPLKPGENPVYGVIHNVDLLELINDLWAAGSKAISVNNQRINTLTGISCIGPTILINKTRVVPPFVVKAIGNSEKLSNAIEKSHLHSLESYGIKYFIEKYEKIEIPADSNIILAGDF